MLASEPSPSAWVSAADDSAEELSEEDQQLKNELEMLVERLKVRQPVQFTR